VWINGYLKPKPFALDRHSFASFCFPKFPRATDLLYHTKPELGFISIALSKHFIALWVLPNSLEAVPLFNHAAA